LIDQEEIHKQCQSEDSRKRDKALKQLKDNFSLLPDKQQAFREIDERQMLITDFA
jgi:hypothetical protein